MPLSLQLMIDGNTEEPFNLPGPQVVFEDTNHGLTQDGIYTGRQQVIPVEEDSNTEVLYGAEKNSSKIKVGAVSYLNTKPLIYGFGKGLMEDEVELVIDHPANIAKALLDGTIDIGLVPVAIIPQLETPFIVADYCIGANGEVASVCLFSDVPLEQIKTVLLDYQSRTSVMLVKYLFQQYWKLKPEFVDAGEDFRGAIAGSTAAVVIGDRAFEQRKISPYCYDLSLAWKKHTGLPFVFAAWVANKPFSKTFTANFNAVNSLGLQHLQEIVKDNPYKVFDLYKYYTQYIQYILDDEKREGLQLFLNWCSSFYEQD